MKDKKEKVITLGSIISLIIGILLAYYFIWSYPKFHTDPEMKEFVGGYNRIFQAYILGLFSSFWGVYTSSKSNYKRNHFWRALIYSPGSFFSWPFYSGELYDKRYRETDHSHDKWWQKNNPWYGVMAILVVILIFWFMFWYAAKYYDVHPFEY